MLPGLPLQCGKWDQRPATVVSPVRVARLKGRSRLGMWERGEVLWVVGSVLPSKTLRKGSEARSKKGNPGKARDSTGVHEARKRGKTEKHPNSRGPAWLPG